MTGGPAGTSDKTRTSRQKRRDSSGREETISQEELGDLLQDRVFVDYFNVFLSLPIFPQKLLYKFDEKEFQYDPPIKRTKHILDRTKLVAWLLEERAPLFLRTELYMEYILCKELMNTQLFFSGSSRKLDYEEFRHHEDAVLLEEIIGHVVGMCRFRKYLEGTPGEQVLSFWMDAERLNHIPTTDTESRWLCFRELQLKYFKIEALTSIQKSDAWEILSDGSSLYGDLPFQLTGADVAFPANISTTALETYITQTIDRPAEADFNDTQFRELQELVLAVIKDYWLQKYLLHCKALQLKRERILDSDEIMGITIRSQSDLSILKDVKNIDKALTLLHGNKNKSKVKERRGRISWNAMFPENQVDDTFLIPTDEVVTIHKDGNVTVELAQSEAFEKMLQRYLSESSESSGGEERITFRKGRPSPPSSRSSSTTSTPRNSAGSPGRHARRQSIDLMKRIALAEARRQGPSTPQGTKSKLDLFEQLLNLHAAHDKLAPQGTKDTERPQSCPAKPLPFERNSGGHDTGNKRNTGTGTPSKKHQKQQVRKTIIDEELKNLPTIQENEALSMSAPAGLRSFSKFHPGTMLAKPDFKYHNMCEGYYRYDHATYVMTLAADRLAGTPFQNFLLARRYPYYDWQILNLWNDIQVYLATKVTDSSNLSDYLRFRRAKAFMMRYLSAVSERPIQCLPPGLNLMLQRLIPEGRGDDLLRDAQDLISEYLKKAWLRFKKFDKNLFLETVLVKKKPRVALSLTPRAVSVPPYFDRQTTVARPPSVPSVNEAAEPNAQESEDKPDQEELSPEMLAEKRSHKALQLILDISDFYTEGLPIETISEHDLIFDLESPDGSLHVQPLVKYIRPDIEEETERQRKLARVRAARLAALEHEGQAATRRLLSRDDDDTPYYMKPFKKGGTHYNRPMMPRSFGEIFRCPIHFEFFRRYLSYNQSETPLQFYQAIEDLKKTKEPKIRQQKNNQVFRRYFNTKVGKGPDSLQCNADVIRDIPRVDKVTTSMLISAQSCVFRSLEHNWFTKYQETFPSDDTSITMAVKILTDGGRRTWGKERTKSLWVSFIQGVVRFRRGIHNHDSSQQFQEYLKMETKKEIERQKNSGQPWIHGMPVKKLIKNKMTDMTKLSGDLQFLAEADRYRTMCDESADAARAGNYNIHDQVLLEKKAQMIVDCFIESELLPKIQINATQEVAENIVDSLQNNMIERGLFHDATITIFPTLAYLWKKFVRHRYCMMFESYQAKQTERSLVASRPPTPDYLNMGQVKIRRVIAHHEDHPRMVFTMTNGARFLIPGSRENPAQHRGTAHNVHEHFPDGLGGSESTRTPLHLDDMAQGGGSLRRGARDAQELAAIRDSMLYHSTKGQGSRHQSSTMSFNQDRGKINGPGPRSPHHANSRSHFFRPDSINGTRPSQRESHYRTESHSRHMHGGNDQHLVHHKPTEIHLPPLHLQTTLE